MKPDVLRTPTHGRSDCTADTGGGAATSSRMPASLLLQQQEWRRNIEDVLDGIDHLLPLDPKLYTPWADW